MFASSEGVPFRYTPNLQHFVGPIGTEGLLVSGIVSIARALTTPEVTRFTPTLVYLLTLHRQFDLDQQLCLFARDEVLTWLHTRGLPLTIDMTFRNHVASNIEGVVKKAELMACKHERSQVRNHHRCFCDLDTIAFARTQKTTRNRFKRCRPSQIWYPWPRIPLNCQ